MKIQDLRGKHFIVTGANTGIGYANARELAKMGAKVTIACRSESKGRAALEKIRQEALETPVKEVRGRKRERKKATLTTACYFFLLSRVSSASARLVFQTALRIRNRCVIFHSLLYHFR